MRMISGGPWMIQDLVDSQAMVSLLQSVWAVFWKDYSFDLAIETQHDVLLWNGNPNYCFYCRKAHPSWPSYQRDGERPFCTVCVKIALELLMVGQVWIWDHWHRVEFKSLHLICASCGCFGHVARKCVKEVTNTDGALHRVVRGTVKWHKAIFGVEKLSILMEVVCCWGKHSHTFSMKRNFLHLYCACQKLEEKTFFNAFGD